MILISDFDETIYFPDNPEVNKKNIEAINKFSSSGNIFCIATGRNYCDLKKLLNENKIDYSYLICEDGAKIINYVDYCISTTLLEKKDIDDIIPILEELNCDYYLDDGYSKTENKNDCVKIVINCSNAEEKTRLVEILKEKINAHLYASRIHINIIEKSVNKENGIKKLLNHENLDYDLVRVIGDNDNDYQMLKTFKGATLKKHHPLLNELNLKEYETLSDYIEELMKS